MAGRLAGKMALVTAAGQGMGFACAMQMAAEGATVYATDVKPELLESFKRRGERRRRATLDVLDDDAVRTTDRRAAAARRPVQLRGVRAPRHDPRHARRRTGTSASTSTCARCTSRSRRRCRRCSTSTRRPASGRRSSTWPRSQARSRASRTASCTARARRRSIGLTKSVAADFVQKGIRCNCDRAGNGGHAVARRAHQRLRRSRRGAQDVHRAAADGPPRQGRGDRADRDLPRVRRIRVRDGTGVFRRRRHDNIKTTTGRPRRPVP